MSRVRKHKNCLNCGRSDWSIDYLECPYCDFVNPVEGDNEPLFLNSLRGLLEEMYKMGRSDEAVVAHTPQRFERWDQDAKIVVDKLLSRYQIRPIGEDHDR